jgi:hypothetical protein
VDAGDSVLHSIFQQFHCLTFPSYSEL